MVGIPSPRLHPALSAATYWPRFMGTLVGWRGQEGGSQRKLWSLSPGSTRGSWAKYLSRQLSVQKRPFQSHCLPQVAHSAQDPNGKWVTHKACDLQVSLITQTGGKKRKTKGKIGSNNSTSEYVPKESETMASKRCVYTIRLQQNWSVTRSKMWGQSKCLWKSDQQHFVPIYHAALCSHTRKFWQLLHSGWTEDNMLSEIMQSER